MHDGARTNGSGGCTCSGHEPVRDACQLAPTASLLVVECSPCNDWSAAGSGSGVLWLWDVRTGREVWRLQAEALWPAADPKHESTYELSSVSFSGDGKFLLAGAGMT